MIEEYCFLKSSGNIQIKKSRYIEIVYSIYYSDYFLVKMEEIYIYIYKYCEL